MKQSCHKQLFYPIHFQDPMKWAVKATLNVAASGKFSSDRTISEYAKEIWGVEPSLIKLPNPADKGSAKEN